MNNQITIHEAVTEPDISTFGERLLLPPEEIIPFTVEQLQNPEDWQLIKLENGFLEAIGEPSLSDEKKERLKAAVATKQITFLIARRGCRAVGLCSVSTCYSTFVCGEIGIFDDFYVEPCFRGKGIARLLAEAAQRWCAEQGIGSLTVCCAPCDEEMYQSLGFMMRLGATFSWTP